MSGVGRGSQGRQEVGKGGVWGVRQNGFDRELGARAIEVLEQIGTPAARRLREAWAKQTGELYLAAEAATALERSRTKVENEGTPAK